MTFEMIITRFFKQSGGEPLKNILDRRFNLNEVMLYGRKRA